MSKKKRRNPGADFFRFLGEAFVWSQAETREMMERGEYPHGTPMAVVMREELEREKAMGVQLWRHVLPALGRADFL